MRIAGIHGVDVYGVGGALRGQEMGFALGEMGHEIQHLALNVELPELGDAVHKTDAVILTGTWHQLSAGRGKNGLPHPVNVSHACDEAGVPCIWWYGSNGSVFGAPDPDPQKRKAAEQEVIDLICDREFIAVICPYSMDIYERHGVPRQKMRLVPSVFDAGLFCPESSAYDKQLSKRLRYKFGISEKSFVIGTVAHTPNSKGADEMIQAVAILKKEMPDLLYVMLHSPEQTLNRNRAKSADGKRLGKSEWQVYDDTRQLAQRLGLKDQVRFLGMRFPRVAMPTFYRLMDAYASPSKAENLGQPLVESQLCGLPLITFKGFSFDFVSHPRHSVQVDVHHTETDDYGLVIPFADPQVLADGIRKARDIAESSAWTDIRAWAWQKFHHDNAKHMINAIEEYRDLMKTSTIIADRQKAVGDQKRAMVNGYDSAAQRIELEIGKPIGKVLDIGCNTGSGLEVLSERWPDGHIFAIEPVGKFAAKARERGFKVETAPAEKLPYNDDGFDLVFSRHSLEHTEDRVKAVSEFLRILKPGGYLYVQAPIEKGGTKNRLHESAFESLEEMHGAFPGFTEIYWGPQETVAEFMGQKPNG